MAQGYKTKSVVVVAPFTPFGSTAATFPDVIVDEATCKITISPTPVWFLDPEIQARNFRIGQGGWLPEHHAEENRRRKKWKKIQEKRERRQEYVMRKIWNELKNIPLEDDPELMALMAEFETPEEVYQSAAEIQKQLNDAYMKYVVEKQIRIGKQDQEDEEAVMLSLMSML